MFFTYLLFLSCALKAMVTGEDGISLVYTMLLVKTVVQTSAWTRQGFEPFQQYAYQPDALVDIRIYASLIMMLWLICKLNYYNYFSQT